MDTTFENITPWNGANDSGLDVRKKWERNFDKVKQNFVELSDLFEKVNIGTASVPVYAIRVKYDLFSLGAISAYGPSASSSSGSGGIDETTLWSIMGNTGTQQIAANHLATALSPYVTQSAMSDTLSNYAPVNHGHVWGDITDRPSSLPASDVYSWAKASSKPNYDFSEITGKPSTLGGYGITDAAAKSHSHVWADITDRPTKLSQFTNDMISTWALAASKPSYSYSEISGTPDLSSLHTHANKDLLDAINQNLSSTGSPIFSKITIGAICLAFDSVNNSLYVQKSDGTSANFYATGGVSSYGAGASSGSGSGIDETTLWSIMGNTGTQQIAANHLATALSPYITQTSLSALLDGYSKVGHGHVWGDITDRPSSLPASDVYAWAKAATKPSYSYSEITDKPTSLPASDVYSWAKAASKPGYSYSEISGTPDLSSLHTHSNKDLLDAINQNLSSTGSPIFSKITIGAICLAFDSVNNSLYVQKSDGTSANFYATGGVSSYGAGASSGSGSGIDETTLWSIMGNTGTQQIAANHLATALSPYITQTSLSALLDGYSKVGHGHVWGDITDRPSSLPASDVYAWAKAATKPSYDFSEITGKPSTLGGYGITDAASAASLVNYLPLAGGIMTGPLTIQPNQRQIIFRPQYPGWYGSLGYDTTGGECFGIMFQNVGTKFKVKAGYDSSTFAGNGAYTNMSDADLEIGAGYGKIAGYTIWHAGNVGSGSGLDADMLDGRHYYQYVYDIGGGYSGKIYDLPSKVVFSGMDLTDAPVSGWVSGLTLAFNWNDNHYQNYLVSGGWHRWYSGDSSNPITWKQFAFLTDNVASATKLYTARSFTIGNTAKSFDGTGNVSWSLSEIGAAAAIHNHTISQITDIANASVNYAASAGNANTLGGWALSDIYSDLSDTSLSPNSLIVNYDTATSDNSLFSFVGGNQAKVINSFYGSSYAAQLAFGFGNNRLAYRKKAGTESWSQWMNIDCGNADTATRLQTARSIFNIPFDGSADCNGSAYIGGKLGVSYIPQSGDEMLSVAGGNIKLYSFQNVASQYTYIGSEYAHGNGNNKAEIRFAIDDSGDTCTRLTFHTANGVGTLYERMRISSNGNVGIGITSPSYRLHVSGTGYFSDSLSLAATLSAAGLINANGNIKTTNYIEIGSTGIRIMYDSTNDCLKLIKSDGSAVNLLVTGGVTALATA